MRTSVRVFDLDNTLIDTSARVLCVSSDESFGSNEYNQMESEKNVLDKSAYDYSQFSDLQRLINDRKLVAWESIQDGDLIITGRADTDVIESFFTHNNKNVNINCCPPDLSISYFKSTVLAHALQHEYAAVADVYIYEDNPAYARAMCEVVKAAKKHYFWYRPVDNNKLVLEQYN